MKKACLITGISLFFLFSCGQKTQHVPLVEMELEIQNKNFTQTQVDEAIDILKKRIVNAGSKTTIVNFNKERKTITVQLDSIGVGITRGQLIMPQKMEFLECYTINELAPLLKEIDSEVSKQSNSKNALINFDELKARGIKEYFFFALMNPAQPYNEKNGRQVFPPQIGNVSEHDTASFNALIPLAKTILPVDCKFVYGKKQVTLSNRTGYYELYAVKDDNNKMEVNSCLEKIEAADDERGRPCIRLRFNALGTKIWARMTTKNVNRDIAMVIDDMVYSAPRVSGPIEGGNSMISGIFSDEEARMTTGMISAGYLPLHLRVVAIKVLPDKK